MEVVNAPPASATDDSHYGSYGGWTRILEWASVGPAGSRSGHRIRHLFHGKWEIRHEQ